MEAQIGRPESFDVPWCASGLTSMQFDQVCRRKPIFDLYIKSTIDLHDAIEQSGTVVLVVGWLLFKADQFAKYLSSRVQML